MSEINKTPKPQASIEKVLTAIWCQALGVKNIKEDDNFFDLGGDQSLALHLVERMRTYLGIEIPINSIIENPTVKELAQRVQSASQSAAKSTLATQSKEPEYCASFSQVHLWQQYNLDPDSHADNLFSTYSLRGSLDRKAFEHALRMLMQRHESLRTVLYSRQKELLQRVIKPDLTFAYENIEHTTGSEPELHLRQLIEAEVQRPFVLETGPLFRCLLIAVSPGYHMLVLNAHHIITDAWSQHVMIADLMQLYRAIAKGVPPALPKLKMQYGNFAERQRECLSGPEWDRQSQYWKAQLAGAPCVLSLPTDHPGTEDTGFLPAGIHSFALGEELSAKLRSLSLSNRATLFMTLLAVFQVLMSRYCWQDDLCIASPIANRPLKETEDLIGFFVNTLILRSNVEDNPPFTKFLSRTREAVLEALDHSGMPFDEIVGMFHPQHSVGSTPYPQIMFTLQNVPHHLFQEEELAFEPVTLVAGIPKFDLSLVLEEKNGEQKITGHFSFRTQLFEQTTIERIAVCYLTLLHSAVNNPSCPVFQLEILGGQESKQVLDEWNRPMPSAQAVFLSEAETNRPTIHEPGDRSGNGISHSQPYILDRYLQLVPPGAAGELYVAEGTDVLGNSAHNEQNRESIKNPFGPGELYRSHQLVHTLNDGRIELIGNVDERDKVRDKKINPVQIESVLQRHPDVRESALTADQNGITVYVVPKKDALSHLDRLRAELRNTLARCTTSAALVFVPALLLTSDGQPDFAKMAESDALDDPLPLTRTQKILVNIWRNILGIQNVSIYDNFFELGGNSLLAVRIATEARQRGLHFASRALFKHQSIADLASIVKLPQSQIDQALSKDRDWWPTSPIQRWFFDRNFFNPAFWNMFALFKANGTIDVSLLRLAVEHLVQRHIALRLQFRQREGEWVQYIVEKTSNIFHFFDLSHLDPAMQLDEMTRLGNQLQSSFSFNEGMLICFGFFNLGSQGARLLIAAHHLVCDGFSLNVVMEDLASIYASLSESARWEGGDSRSSFLEWALLVHTPSTLANVIAESSYWAPKRDGSLPLDFPDGKNLVASIRRVHTELTPSETNGLLVLARQKYHTSIEVLLAWGVSSCLMDWKNEQFAVLTVLGHGRENEWAHLDLSRAVGYFTVHYPLVVEIPAGTNPEDAVEMVRWQLDAVPNQGIGYCILRFIYNKMYPDRRVPLQEEGDISFNYLGNYDLNLAPKGLFTIASEKAGLGRESRADNPYRFGYFGYILNGALHTEWWFNLGLHKVETIEAVASSFQQKLRSLLARQT